MQRKEKKGNIIHMKSVCFAGHRNLNVTPEIKERLGETLKALIERGAEDFYAGGALGWDMLCEDVVLELKENFPNIKLNIILPCPADQQTAKWNAKQKSHFYTILKGADSVEVVSKKFFYSCTKIRNRRLVELSECCVCYFDVKNYSGSTGQTLLMAEKANLVVFNIAK